MNPIVGRGTPERGAILIQVAISILALTAFAAFVTDYGVLWVARGQAQNAADAGALAGAIALAYDDTTYPPTVNPDLVKLSAAYAALCASGSSSCTSTPSAADPIWPAQSGASSAVDVLFECPPGFSGNCVRVNVYRNGQSGNVIGGPSWMLPTFFGPLLGIHSPTAAGPLAAGHGVKATASARVAAANGTDCLRPFAIPDAFWDNDGDGIFSPGDDYDPPTSDATGTGYQPQYDVGTEVILKDDAAISSGNFRLLDLLGGRGGGSKQASEVIKACTPDSWALGDQLLSKSGVDTGITAALNDVYALDPGALWDTDQNKIINSCVDTHTCSKYVMDSSGDLTLVANPTATVSPRVLALPLYDPEKEAIAQAGCPNCDDLEIVNFIGFFYTSIDELPFKQIHGRIVTEAGLNVQTGGSRTVSMDSAFLKMIQLIR
jgi:Putative Flp pilus-assembly TadE/G-like